MYLIPVHAVKMICFLFLARKLLSYIHVYVCVCVGVSRCVYSCEFRCVCMCVRTFLCLRTPQARSGNDLHACVHACMRSGVRAGGHAQLNQAHLRYDKSL
jgi:hypothetical protein